MAMDTSDIKGRDARDQIINTLGLGLTYPLRDLPVEHRTLISVDLPAEMYIPDAQTGVWYQLCDEDGNPMTLADLAVGMVVEIHGKDDEGKLVAERVNFKDPDSDTTEGLVEDAGEVTLTGAIEVLADDLGSTPYRVRFTVTVAPTSFWPLYGELHPETVRESVAWGKDRRDGRT